MKWFTSLKKAYRIIIAVCAWLPLVIFLAAISGSIGTNGEGVQLWQSFVMLLLLALGVFFTVFAVIASKREKGAKQAVATPDTPEKQPRANTRPQTTNPRPAPAITARIVQAPATALFKCRLIKNGNSEMQDNIACCNVGDVVIADEDIETGLKICSHDVGDIGYFAESYGDRIRDNMRLVISDIIENDNGKLSVEVTAYSQYADGITFPIHTKVAGVSFGNRQAVVKESRAGDPLIIKHTPSNEYPSAAAIYNGRTGRALGHVQADLAEKFRSAFGNGYVLNGKITEITGGTPATPNYGCNILITSKKT